MPIDTGRIHCGYLGHTAFPKDITEFEIREFFTLSAADLRAIRVDSNRKSRLALALQVGFLRMPLLRISRSLPAAIQTGVHELPDKIEDDNGASQGNTPPSP